MELVNHGHSEEFVADTLLGYIETRGILACWQAGKGFFAVNATVNIASFLLHSAMLCQLPYGGARRFKFAAFLLKSVSSRSRLELAFY